MIRASAIPGIFRPAILSVGLAGVIMACGIGTSGTVVGGWVWPTAAPLPAGATAVPLDVGSVPAAVEPDAEYAACPAALMLPVTIHLVPDDAVSPVHYRSVQDGHEAHVRWPVGFSARLNPGLEIVAPDGTVVAREGVPVEGLGGGVLGDDDTFTVCIGDYAPKRVGAGQS